MGDRYSIQSYDYSIVIVADCTHNIYKQSLCGQPV